MLILLLILCVFALAVGGGWYGWHWLYSFAVFAVAAPMAGAILTNMDVDFREGAFWLVAVLASTQIAF